MTVQELIDILATFNPEDNIGILCAGDLDTYEVVTSIGFDEELMQVVITVE
jgi:hypothetical protein